MRRAHLRTTGLVLCLLAAGCGQISVQSATPAADAPLSAGDIDASSDVGPGVDGVNADAAVPGNECETAFDCNEVIKDKTPCILPDCVNGYCVKKQRKAGEPCVDPAQPPGECSETVCSDVGACMLQPSKDNTACGLGNCGHKCSAGQCVTATDADYEDGNPCTKDLCYNGLEIKHEAITDLTMSCDDKNACTGGDVCIKGSCQGKAVDCSDGFGCTLDTCDGKTGCVHTADNSKCDDGNPCSNDACDLAVGCTIDGGTSGLTCDDQNACTENDACTSVGTCTGNSVCGCLQDSDCKSSNKCLGQQICVKKVCIIDPEKSVKCNQNPENLCLLESCDPATGTCEPSAVHEGDPCEDGNACTLAPTCKAGLCLGPADLDCDDKNPCTSDGCDPTLGCVYLPTNLACDDGNPCTQADGCAKGACTGQALPCDDGIACSLDGCDPKTGACTHAGSDPACSDGNPCTADSCDVASGCKHGADDAAACDDGNGCTSDSCQGGVCLSKFSCQCKVASQAADCNDKNPCTVDTCDPVALKCVYTTASVDGSVCTPGDKCLLAGTGTCAAGNCTGGKAIDCSASGDVCNAGTCDPQTGACAAIAKVDGTACDFDQNGCSANDACKAGKCAAGAAADCSGAADACNAATCQSTGASTFTCVKSPKTATTLCDDGKFCTTGDHCDGSGGCVGPTAKTCGAQYDACNSGQCDEAGKQCLKVPKASSVLCNDGLYCSTGDHCDGAGSCVGAGSVACPGGNCVIGVCDEVGDKCTTAPAPAATACNDNNACTSGEQCSDSGVCQGGTQKVCPGDGCIEGTCDPLTAACGSQTKADGAACDDKDACTTGESCSAGVCKAGTYTCACKVATQAADCNDSNVCTTDACVQSAGLWICQHSGIAGTSCSDNNACTVGDLCSTQGLCTPGTAKTCSGDVCNDGACDAATGNCGLKPKSVATTCDDGNACTSGDACAAGVCKAGAYTCACTVVSQATACNDNNACTADVCVNVSGLWVCKNNITPSANCDDKNACTTTDVCTSGGGCAGSTLNCSDNNVCTDDSCSPTSGCAHAANTAPCDDGDACTSGDTCGASTCKAGTWSCECTVANQTKDCDDANSCTLDSCVKVGTIYQCKHTAQAGATCDDGDPCSTASTCTSAGSCTASKLFDCSGTKDACNSGACTASGSSPVCKKVPTPGVACSDGLACTSSDTCNGSGVCTGGEATLCPLASDCLLAACKEPTGCTYSAAPVGTSCSDGDPCTAGDSCGGGVCLSGAKVADFTACDDGKASTSADLCVLGTCAGFSLSTGPQGPATSIAWQSKTSSWLMTASDSQLTSITGTGGWNMWSVSAASGGGTTMSPMYSAMTNSLRASTSQIVVGFGNQIIASSGNGGWFFPPSGALYTAVKALGISVADWYAVDQRVVSGIMYVQLAGTQGSTSPPKAAIVRCFGPEDMSGTWTCLQPSTGTGVLPMGASVALQDQGCSPLPCPALPQYTVAGLQRFGQYYSQMVAYAFSLPSTYSPILAPAFTTTPKPSTVIGGTYLYDSSVIAPAAGSSLLWLVGPAGHVSYEVQGSNGLLLAQVTSLYAQSNYVFSAVTVSPTGNVLLWGSRPIDGVTATQMVPVLLVHADTPGQQDGAKYWQEFQLAQAPYDKNLCSSGSGVSTAGMALAPDGTLALVGNYCGNTVAGFNTFPKAMLYTRPPK